MWDAHISHHTIHGLETFTLAAQGVHVVVFLDGENTPRNTYPTVKDYGHL